MTPDLTRNTRQGQFLADIFSRVVEAVAPHLTIDDQLTLADAASWLWNYRSSEVRTAELPVAYQKTGQGASVLVPKVDVEDFASGIRS